MQAETQARRRLTLKVGERENVHADLDELYRTLDGNQPNEAQQKQIDTMRGDLAYLDNEVDTLSKQVEADDAAAAKSAKLRRDAMAARGVADVDENGEIVYRSLGQVAIDQILTSTNRHARAAVSSSGVADDEVQRAAQRLQSLERLERTPATTLSSDIAGLTPPQHIAQIFQIINSDRALVDAAPKVDLQNLVWTYPQVDAGPVVAAQGTQKTEAGNTGMDVSMVSKTATTYLGGGNLSWQAISFSNPNAYDLWFRLIAADYALKTETDAATVVSASAFLNNASTTISTTATFAEFMAAVGLGYNEVFANSGRIANSIIMAPDRFGYLLGTTSAAFSQFVSVGQDGIGPLRIIVSRGLNAGEVIVGDINGLLVAENAGAPVRMFVSEPAIAGVEVGLVGLFDAAVVDDGAFSLISTAS